MRAKENKMQKTSEHFDELYLENLDEYVNDEHRIVTYKWLSHTLSVHVNQAKRMLQNFVDKERKEKRNSKLCVTYFVSGVTREANVEVQNCQLVPEDSLSDVKSKFNSVNSCHVYSVSQSKVKDQATLYQADYDITKEHLMESNKYSAIVCKEAVVRSDADLERLRETAQPTTDSPSFSKPKTGSNEPKKPAGIVGMFASAGNKKSRDNCGDGDNQKKLDNTTESDSKKPQTKGKSGHIANFFSNQVGRPKKNTSSENGKSEDKSSKKPSLKSNDNIKGKKKDREDSDEEEIHQKKRRRIKQVVLSSSSEDEQEDEEPLPEPAREPTPPPASPPPQQPSPQPQKMETSPAKPNSQSVSKATKSDTNGVKKRKRQKKLISKSFIDEDGFMVTEKVWHSESESCSDEDIIPPTPPVTKATKPAANTTEKRSPTEKKPIAKKKTDTGAKKGAKQASLMSFFKKK